MTESAIDNSEPIIQTTDLTEVLNLLQVLSENIQVTNSFLAIIVGFCFVTATFNFAVFRKK